MLYAIGLTLLTISTFIDGVSGVMCYDGSYYYYCSAGQTCGYYYGDCRGLPTYAIISIISGCILLLSICIRCCIYATNPNRQPVRRGVVVTRGGRVVRNPATGYQGPTSTVVPIHPVQEEAPPSYYVATSTENPKY